MMPLLGRCSPSMRLRVLSLGGASNRHARADGRAWRGHADTDCAIVADTALGTSRNLDHLAWLASASVLPFAVLVVSARNIPATCSVPLVEADLPAPEDDGQLDLWGNECAGLCGV